ncbi:MAG TPA: DNA repair protein RadC [Rickettsia endosymbiont of Pyrocoelia pectoralis]|nr:DNA repair protein RadC [Rickettsia endosymbiont of Pyrocoelia pectoralis]
MLETNLIEFDNDDIDVSHYIGHRKRTKERFINAGATHFSDYELLELLLFSAIPRKDVKPLAKKLLDNFKTITDLVNLDKDRLLSIKGTNENLYINFAIIRELINRVLKQKIINKNIIASWGSLIDYLKINMGNMRLEQFRVLFLNKKNILIADEILSQGTIDQAAVYPREIIKRALFNEASSIILVHNHPSGSPEPSKSDVDTTNKIVETCQTVNIVVHDHVIISNNKYYSFKSNMLL